MCRRHYHEFYRHLHHPSVCSSCGARPKTGTRFSWHTPDAHLISKHLSETTGTTVTFKPMDYICYRCSTAHVNLHVIKDIHSLECIQRRASKFILHNFSADYKSRLIELNMFPLMYILARITGHHSSHKMRQGSFRKLYTIKICVIH